MNDERKRLQVSEWQYGWRRLKLTVAEAIILGLAERGCGEKYARHVLGAAHAVRMIREAYYPSRRLDDQPHADA